MLSGISAVADEELIDLREHIVFERSASIHILPHTFLSDFLRLKVTVIEVDVELGKKSLGHPELATKLSKPSLVQKAFTRFWKNHMYTAKSSALFDAVFMAFHEEQLLEVSMCEAKSIS
ncbi:hypothetical protein T10_11606 [Trichinella papuae]|uniref:Uncharacterized protein n=1 Tax=Trichinella papuae TaxID=268474 RepID=A0A0V1N7T8_9BILA|nr:hypothetical protein T10_11606 [Trichinella papuae]